jgi:hypothetical protein
MKFSYDSRDFDFQPDSVDGPEAELIEDAGGTQWETFGEWANRLYRGGWRPLKVALWIMLRRENPTLNFDDLAKVGPGEVFLDLTDDEATEGKDEPGEATTEPGDSPTDSDSLKPDTEASPSN